MSQQFQDTDSVHSIPFSPDPLGSEDLPLRAARCQLDLSLVDGVMSSHSALPTPALLIWTVRLPGTVLSDTWHHDLTSHWWPLRLKTAGTAAQLAMTSILHSCLTSGLGKFKLIAKENVQECWIASVNETLGLGISGRCPLWRHPHLLGHPAKAPSHSGTLPTPILFEIYGLGPVWIPGL